MSIVYFLYANLAESEVIHFYIPSSELQEEDYERLRLASDPICDSKVKEYRSLNGGNIIAMVHKHEILHIPIVYLLLKKRNNLLKNT